MKQGRWLGESDWPFKAGQSDSFASSSRQSDQLYSGRSSAPFSLKGHRLVRLHSWL